MDLDGFESAADAVSSSLPLPTSSLEALHALDEQWYFLTNRRGRWMDLIGDYAGSELFIIDGDALFQEVLNDQLLALGRSDDPSFQILHAKWSLERLLSDFKMRSTTFEIVFWEVGRHSTVLSGSSDFVVASRALARAMLFTHLHRLDVPIHTFKDLSDPEWLRYERSKKPMFVMTNDGGVVNAKSPSVAADADRALTCRVFMFDLLAGGCAVSLLHGAEYRDSKIMSFVYEQRLDRGARKRMPKELWTISSAALRVMEAREGRARHGIPVKPLETLKPQYEQFSRGQESYVTPLILDELSIHFPGESLRRGIFYLFLAHILVVPTLSLLERVRKVDPLDPKLTKYLLNSFLPAKLVSLEGVVAQAENLDIDGRVFIALLSFVTRSPCASLSEALGEEVVARLDSMWSSLGLPRVDLASLAAQYSSSSLPREAELPSAPAISNLLPFSHPLFDVELASVHVDVGEDADPRLSHMEFNTVFNDVYHWHSNRTILPPHLGGEDAPPMDERQRRKKLRSDQRFMATLERQAQTLTGAFGIPLERQTIVSAKSRVSHAKSTGTVPKVEGNASRPSKKEKPGRLSSADKIRQANIAKKQVKEDDSNQSWWQEQLKACSTMPVTEQIGVIESLQRNKRMSEGWLPVEVRLYRVHLEFLHWIDRADREDGTVRDQAIVRILRLAKDTYQQKGLFPTAVGILGTVLAVVGLSSIVSDLETTSGEIAADRTLGFKFVKLVRSKSGSPAYKWMNIDEDPIVWQMRLFGEYMDRSMDSQSDPRVSFRPDAWQRKVLDCLDDNKSVLVVAPTSAGKTFISYYAMEQVLKSSDDGILVYVAPTKALVSQIAAEVYARFRKDLNGRSCWAIHTRDYRVHNPQKCQILVTVPEMLAIMLLSPTLARAWTPRIKRIILDEIHSIGQQQEGAVWEQIILLAPCPIIGLSATIGHPERFNSWLQSVQEAHGYRHELIIHPHRYSHLRKFTYRLKTRERESFAGLRTHVDTHCMTFLHPVSMLSFGVRELPPDFSLEASDCLSLFQAFWSVRDEVPFDVEALHPSRFFADSPIHMLRQMDILQYEAALKVGLTDLLHSSDPAKRSASPLNRVINHLMDPSLRNSDTQFVHSTETFFGNLIFLVSDLYLNGDLPAILFSFDRTACELMGKTLLAELEEAEFAWRENSPEWTQKVRQWERWKSQAKDRERQAERQSRQKRDATEHEAGGVPSSWESTFDPTDPSPGFSFAGLSPAYSKRDLDDDIKGLQRWGAVPSWALQALRRGIGVHHAGMNKRYRSLIESLYRLGYLKVVIATGTLALGINAPTRTSVFCADSPFLTALMYRQCAGRAGRRGYDLLGKVVFFGLPMDRCYRLVLSRLPSLSGNWPLTNTMVLRLLNLLQGSDNAPVAIDSIRSLLRLPQIGFTSDVGKEQLLHFVRFSIDYLRRAGLLDPQGNPINLFGIAAHLYYTEPGNIALVTLFREGIIHKICSQANSVVARKDLVTLLCHLFSRRYLPQSYTTDQNLQQLIKKSPSMVALPALRKDASSVLRQHDEEILSVFNGYALAYATQYSEHIGPDIQMPLSNMVLDSQLSQHMSPFREYMQHTSIPVTVRSQFVANSGHGDTFRTVEELSTTVRRGLNLNQYAIPSMSAFHASTKDRNSFALNAYLLDFYIHGQPAALKKANGIRDNDIWYLLEDFTLTLKTIRAGVGRLLQAAGGQTKDADEDDVDGVDDLDSGYGTYDATDTDEEGDGSTNTISRPPGVSDRDWKVYEVLDAVTIEFDAKFREMWA